MVRALNLTGHVGFDSLPDQLVNKSVSQGFCFNILCVGEYWSSISHVDKAMPHVNLVTQESTCRDTKSLVFPFFFPVFFFLLLLLLF